jgi:hypothetical protein
MASQLRLFIFILSNLALIRHGCSPLLPESLSFSTASSSSSSSMRSSTLRMRTLGASSIQAIGDSSV